MSAVQTRTAPLLIWTLIVVKHKQEKHLERIECYTPQFSLEHNSTAVRHKLRCTVSQIEPNC